MKTLTSRLLIGLTAAAWLTLPGLAGGQTPQEPPVQRTPAPSSKVKLSLEDEHVIKENVKDLKVAPASSKTPETVGAAVPKDELHPLPPVVGDKVPQIKSHLFFMKEGHVFLVDPKDDSIVDEIN